MRVTAGILMIIGGLLGGTLWFSISGYLVPDTLGFIGILIRFLPAFLAVIGGIYALKRKHWRWALAGSICSLLFPFTGIPAVILLIKSKDEFQA
ncbi:hypothetical protein ES703_23683 [subsurface metagenome]